VAFVWEAEKYTDYHCNRRSRQLSEHRDLRNLGQVPDSLEVQDTFGTDTFGVQALLMYLALELLDIE
jgi:hypothetical protein